MQRIFTTTTKFINIKILIVGEIKRGVFYGKIIRNRKVLSSLN